jgi:hypothetical protein
MEKTTHMQRFALALAAVGCMTVPVPGALAQAAPQQLQLASNAAPAPAAYSSSDAAVDAPAPTQAAPSQQYGAGTPGYAAPVESHSYWHTHGFDLAGLATGRLQQNIDEQGPTQVGQSFNAGFLANIREHPVSWAGIELDYGYQKYTEHYRFAANAPSALNRPMEQHEATAGYVFHIKTPWVQPFVVLGGGGIYFRSTRIQPPAGNGLNEPIGDQWRGTYMANVGFDFTSKRAKNFGIRIEEHSLFYKAPDFYMGSLRSNAWIHQAMPAAGFFYRF